MLDGACEKHICVPLILGGGEDAGDEVVAFLGFLRRAGDPLLVLATVLLPHDVDVTERRADHQAHQSHIPILLGVFLWENVDGHRRGFTCKRIDFTLHSCMCRYI